MKKILYTVLGLILAVSTFAWLDTPQRAEAAITLTIANPVGTPNACTASTNPTLNVDLGITATAPDSAPVNIEVKRSSPMGNSTLPAFPVDVLTGYGFGNGGIFNVAMPANSVFVYTFVRSSDQAFLGSVSLDCTTGAILSVQIGGIADVVSPLAVTDPTGDADGDNVRNGQDNCVLVANADQANDWGSSQGDACDTSFFDNGRGVKAFQRRNGNFNIFACTGGDCVFVGEIITSTLGSGQQTFQGSDARGWSVVVGLLSDSGTERIYQVFTLDPNGNIVDDTFFIIIGPDYINWRGSSTSGGLKLSEVVALVGGSSNGGSTSALIPAGFEVYIPNARINPPGFTANPSVRPGDQAVAIGSVNIRIAPDLKADQTGVQVPYGAIVTVIEEGGGGYWFYVVGDGFEGWVVNEWFAPIN